MRRLSDFLRVFSVSKLGCRSLCGLAFGLSLSVGCAEEASSRPARPEVVEVTQVADASKATQAAVAPQAASASATVPSVWLTADEIRDGWLQLFDGKSLFGWKANNEVDWHVTDDGLIEASQGKPGLLLTTVPFADYEFRCEYWLEKAANSGVFLRTAFEPKGAAIDCYELNMWDAAPEFKTASLVGRAKPKQEVTGEEVWKTVHVVCEGKRITAKFDGQEVLDFTDDSANFCRGGFIGLQKNAGKVRFRKVALKPLGTQQLFNGQDLKGWHVVPGSKSTFSVADGAIDVKNGQGFLESDAAFANLTLQFEAKTNGDGLNSGVFFRLIPGTEKAPSHGYEFQIQNAFDDGDRSKPHDFGTGAIFRRSKARWVVANDREWFTATLVAHGPRFAGWVNGLQVTDWEDTRKPDENPRLGLKLEAGPISLQGHDKTTDLQFRSLRAGEYPITPSANK